MSRDAQHAPDLASALERLLSAAQGAELAPDTRRLIATYRSGTPPMTPAISTRLAALAYAAYRMPATHAAIALALRQTARAQPEFAPASQLGVGGGTGAALWAAAEVWPTLTHAVVHDISGAAIEVGGQLAALSGSATLRATSWQRVTATPRQLPSADLVTMAYLLGELAGADRAALIAAASRAGDVVVVVEPGTPAGYARVIEARDVLLGEGLAVIAPCPHGHRCPLRGSGDWCHFGVRLNRSARHRQLKGAALGHEDEKHAYVAAARGHRSSTPDRIIRRPRQRPGLVEFELCTRDDGIRTLRVPRSEGDLYRDARDVGWGQTWEP